MSTFKHHCGLVGLAVSAVIAVSVPNSGAAVPLSLGADISGLCTPVRVECMVIDIGDEECSVCIVDTKCQTSHVDKRCK